MEKLKGLPLVQVEKRNPLSSGGSDVSQCLFHCIFEQAGVGVAEIGPFENRIVRANTAFAQLLGRAPQELIHKQLAELTSSTDSQTSEAEQLARLWRGETKTCSWYASYKTPSGQLCNAKGLGQRDVGTWDDPYLVHHCAR
jgi:PAS domain S-box-containing protein